ncbi:MAG TPA: hypothetical protein VLL52_04450 [Anaerolineae bacterium]|nr:hypothetical protein [Anaerolineae bacterium]
MDNALIRYEFTEDGRQIIDLSFNDIEDIYSSFDYDVPHVNRNLDEALVEYILGCATELGRNKFIIRLQIETVVDKELRKQILQGIRYYFYYRAGRVRSERRALMLRSLLLGGMGASLLLMVTLSSFNEGLSNQLGYNIISQGTTVAAWLLLWESMSTWFLQLWPLQRRIWLLEKICTVEIDIRTVERQKG